MKIIDRIFKMRSKAEVELFILSYIAAHPDCRGIEVSEAFAARSFWESLRFSSVWARLASYYTDDPPKIIARKTRVLTGRTLHDGTPMYVHRYTLASSVKKEERP